MKIAIKAMGNKVIITIILDAPLAGGKWTMIVWAWILRMKQRLNGRLDSVAIVCLYVFPLRDDQRMNTMMDG